MMTEMMTMMTMVTMKMMNSTAEKKSSCNCNDSAVDYKNQPGTAMRGHMGRPISSAIYLGEGCKRLEL